MDVSTQGSVAESSTSRSSTFVAGGFLGCGLFIGAAASATQRSNACSGKQWRCRLGCKTTTQQETAMLSNIKGPVNNMEDV